MPGPYGAEFYDGEFIPPSELGRCWVAGCQNEARIQVGERKLCAACHDLNLPVENGKDKARPGVRDAYNRVCSGIGSLEVIAVYAKSSDPEFHRLVSELAAARLRLLIWMNEKYEWDYEE